MMVFLVFNGLMMKSLFFLKGFVLVAMAAMFMLLIGYACVSAVLVNNQITESSKMIKAGQALVMSNIKAGHGCIGPDKATLFQGDNGTLAIVGQYKKLSGNSCPTGCQLKYKFSDKGFKEDILGKSIVMDLLNNGDLSKSDQTNLLNHYLPQNLNVDNRKFGDKCDSIALEKK